MTEKTVVDIWTGLGAIGSLFMIVALFAWILWRFIGRESKQDETQNALNQGLIGLLETASANNGKLADALDSLNVQTTQSTAVLSGLVLTVKTAIDDMRHTVVKRDERLETLETSLAKGFTSIESKLDELKIITTKTMTEIRGAVTTLTSIGGYIMSPSRDEQLKKITGLLEKTVSLLTANADSMQHVSDSMQEVGQILRVLKVATSELPPAPDVTPPDNESAGANPKGNSNEIA